MRFLSFSRPWLWAILDLPYDQAKRVENRVWAPPISMIGQLIALHSAKSWDDSALRFFLKLRLDSFPARKQLYPDSVILGVATIDRVITNPSTLTNSQRRWFFGPFGWILTDVWKLPIPVPYRGAQGLRELSPEAEATVTEQLATRAG